MNRHKSFFFYFKIAQFNPFVYIPILPDIPGQGWGEYPGTLDDKVYILFKFGLYKLKKQVLLLLFCWK